MTAGHLWGPDGHCTCGKRLSDISYAAYGPEYIGKVGIAHTGGLMLTEQSEIARDVDHIHAMIMQG